jgi:hypothetical protein
MTAQIAKIILVFLFACSLVSAGGGGSNMGKKKKVVVPWSWLDISTWPLFSTNIQRATKNLEKERKNMEQITDSFEKKTLSRMPQYENSDELDEIYNDEGEIYIDDSEKSKEYPAAFKKYHKLYNTGIKKFNVAKKTCNKAIEEEKKNDPKLATVKENEEVNLASETYQYAKTTIEQIEKFYKKARQIYEQVEQNLGKKSAGKKQETDMHELSNELNDQEKAANDLPQLSDPDSAYDSADDSDEDPEEDVKIGNQFVDVKNFGSIEYEEKQPKNRIDDSFNNYHNANDFEDNDSQNSWKLDQKEVSPYPKSLMTPSRTNVKQLNEFDKLRQSPVYEEDRDSSTSPLRHNQKIQGNVNAPFLITSLGKKTHHYEEDQSENDSNVSSPLPHHLHEKMKKSSDDSDTQYYSFPEIDNKEVKFQKKQNEYRYNYLNK